MKIFSDNAAIEKNLYILKDTIEEYGGRLDPDLSIRCENGELSVEKMGFARHDKPLIALPGELLLPTDKMGISVKNDELLCAPDKSALSDIQCKLTETMIDLYNQTDKIKNHKKSCCWLSMDGAADALEKLLKARSLNKTQEKFLEFAKDDNKTGRDDYDQTLCDTYLKTRTIGHKLKNENGEEMTLSTDIMPIVDFINHHSGGAFFNFGTKYDESAPEREFLQIQDNRPLSFTNECFAFYNQMDAIDSFVMYGFPDMHAMYVRSVPTEFDIPNTGKIVVHSTLSPMHKGALPKNAAGLRPYIPSTLKNDGDVLEITNLLIPTNPLAPQALRRVLRLLITNKAASKRSLSAPQIWECVLETEDKIIRENTAFYQNLIADFENDARKDTPAMQTLLYVARLQLNKLYKYQFDETHFSEEQASADDKIAAAE
ncbi:MAG: hypothetical protein H6867_03455 [Rhodospirillales bacterium]|nr:hypothetical protein [Rhodospirillales bacterium]MCB9996209.1 hypothetical protein [Rhodospirillales bacterium]